MASGVHECGGSAFRRVWVDTRRDPAPILCPSHRLRRLARLDCNRLAWAGTVKAPADAPAPCELLPRSPSIPFAKHLKRLNLAEPEAPPPRRRDVHLTPAAPARHDPPRGPRLADVAPVEPTRIERRIRITYRVELPLRTGRVIDVLV